MYPPAGDEAALPRLSSTNLADEQLDEPSLEVVLEPGDLLYFPRQDYNTISTATVLFSS